MDTYGNISIIRNSPYSFQMPYKEFLSLTQDWYEEWDQYVHKSDLSIQWYKLVKDDKRYPNLCFTYPYVQYKLRELFNIDVVITCDVGSHSLCTVLADSEDDYIKALMLINN